MTLRYEKVHGERKSSGHQMLRLGSFTYSTASSTSV